MKKFIATTFVPTTQDVMNAWEGEGAVPALLEDVVFSYVHMKDLVNKELGGFNIDLPIEKALREDGPCYIVNGDIDSAERFCEKLEGELEFDLDCLIEEYMKEGRVGVKVADDVLAYVKTEAKKAREAIVHDAAATEMKEEISMEASILAKSLGLEIGQKLHLEMGSVIIKDFKLSDEGALVVLNVQGRPEDVTVKASELINLKNKMEESKMTNTTLKLGNQTKVQEAKEMVEKVLGTKDVKMEKQISHVEKIAQTDVAKALLNLNTGNKEETKKEEKVMATRTLRSNNKNNNEVKEMNNTNVKVEEKKEVAGRTMGRTMMGSNAGRPSLMLGSAPKNDRNVEVEVGVFDSVEEYKGGTRELRFGPRLAWYHEVANKNESVMTGEEISDAKSNPNLGIELITLQSPQALAEKRYGGQIQFDDNALAFVEVIMANGHMTIPFKITQEVREKLVETIKSTNIKRKRIGDTWTSVYQHYVKNETEYRVTCACGATNTITEVGAEQNCYKCKAVIGVFEAEAVGGKLNSMGYRAVELNNGFELSEAVLAQVLVFAEYRLRQSAAFGYLFEKEQQ